MEKSLSRNSATTLLRAAMMRSSIISTKRRECSSSMAVDELAFLRAAAALHRRPRLPPRLPLRGAGVGVSVGRFSCWLWFLKEMFKSPGGPLRPLCFHPIW